MALALIIPASILVLLEAGLRFAGVGIDPHFVIQDVVQDEPVLRDNPDIGTLWFKPGLARSPVPFSIPADKSGVRIAVVGESAAMGDPDPAFGISVQLKAILEALYPETTVEVVNAAMTAIDSSVILQITRDLKRLKPDAVIVYMGNNEVVGPFGPESEKRYTSLDAWYARVSLWIRSLRIGQYLLKLVNRDLPSTGIAWQGLSMFADRELSPASPSLLAIHRRYADNLQFIVDAIESYGAVPIIGTMASRLNWPPFSAESHGELAAAESLEAKGQWTGAYYIYRQLLEQQPQSAEWNYRIARTSMAMGDVDGGIAQFTRSRDLDRLRFRVDSEMNRQVNGLVGRAIVVDLEYQFNQYWAEPGRFFWDHVHLTPDGNYIAAAAFAREIIPFLASRGLKASREIPRMDEVKKQIVYTDWDRLNALSAMHQRFLRPPLDGISHHAFFAGDLTARISELRKVVNRERVEECRDRIRSAAQEHPDNFQILTRLGRIYEELGQFEEAFDVYRIMLEKWPHARPVRHAYGRGLVRSGDVDQGLRHLEQGELPGTLLPRLVALIEASSVLAEQGNVEQALELLDRAVSMAPEYAKAWYNRAVVHSRNGQAEQAEKDLLKAIEHEPGLTEAYNNLGVIALKRKDAATAETYFKQALTYQRYHISSLRNLSLAAMMKGEWEASLKYSTMLSHLDPDLEQISDMHKAPVSPP